MKKIYALMLIFSFLYLSVTTYAQTGKTVTTPVTVTLDKAIATPGSTVKITGTSVQLGNNKIVSIEIAKPDKTTVKMSGSLTSQGTYTVKFTDTKWTGEYKVTAKSPDGKSTAKASFRVINAMSIGETTKLLMTSMTSLSSNSSKTMQAAKKIITESEDFPDREKLTKDIAQIEEALLQLPKKMENMSKSLDQLSGVIKQYPESADIPELAELAQELATARNQAEEKIKQAEDLLARVPKSSEMSICDRMDAAVNALAFAGLVFDFGTAALQGVRTVIFALVSTGAKTGIATAYDAVVPVEKRNPLAKTALANAAGNVVQAFDGGTKVLVDYVKTPMGLANDAAQYLIGLGFDRLCERFAGTVEGTLSVDATVAGGKKFWGYKIHIKGRLLMRFEKKQNTGKTPAPLTGEFEGSATKFEAYENLFATNTTAKVLFHTINPPTGAAGDIINWAAFDVLGSMASAMALPYYFKVPVTGALASDGNSIAIKVADAAVKDFKDLKSTAYYASILPGSPIPIVQRFDIPMEDAQFILSRGLRSPATVKIKTTKLSGGAVLKTIEQTFTREEVVSNGEVTVKFNVKLKACNPECP
jgi:hypothetical protein